MPYDGVTGSLGNTTPSSFSYQLRRLSLLLCEAGAALGCVTYLDLEALQGQVGRDSFYDPRMYYIAQMTVSDAALPLLGGAIADIVAACSGRALKCVILDLDGTLWGGVLAEDGIGGLRARRARRGACFFRIASCICVSCAGAVYCLPFAPKTTKTRHARLSAPIRT